MNTLVDFGLPDLETVLDMLFTADNMNTTKEVTTDCFKQWILRDAKVAVSENELRLFMMANPSLCRKSQLIDKEDLMQILGDSYRQKHFEFIENKYNRNLRIDSMSIEPGNLSMDQHNRVMNDDYYRNMATTP